MDALTRAAGALALSLVVAGCAMTPRITDARIVPVGAVETAWGLGVQVARPLRDNDDEISEGLVGMAELAWRFGVAEGYDVGVQAGVPTGISVDTKARVLQTPDVRLALMPTLGASPFTFDSGEHRRHLWAELPVLADVPFGEGHAAAARLGIGTRWYYAASDSGFSSWGHYLAAQLGLSLQSSGHVTQPFIAVDWVMAGRFVLSGLKASVGVAFRFP